VKLRIVANLPQQKWIRAQTGTGGVCGGEVGNGRNFLPITLLSLLGVIPPTLKFHLRFQSFFEQRGEKIRRSLKPFGKQMTLF
jgi:hypothetical protein